MDWLPDIWIEVFGVITGIAFVFLEIKQNNWLWPVGIVTSAVYILVFFTGKLYADMSLQGYYLVISIIGWYWWLKGSKVQRYEGAEVRYDEAGVNSSNGKSLKVSRISTKITLVLLFVFVTLYSVMYFILSRFTDSPVPAADSFVTSLSIVATWMLARKIYEHWYLWIIVNSVSCVLFLTRGLYATVILYAVYFTMSFVGLREWKRSF